MLKLYPDSLQGNTHTPYSNGYGGRLFLAWFGLLGSGLTERDEESGCVSGTWRFSEGSGCPQALQVEEPLAGESSLGEDMEIIRQKSSRLENPDND